MTERLTRRKLIASGAAAGVALALPSRVLPATKTLHVYKLDPCNGADCVACNTCKNYDQFFIFPGRKQANGNRAHIGCNCGIVEGTLDRSAYVALFGNPDVRLTSFRADLRDPAVKAVLKNHPPSF